MSLIGITHLAVNTQPLNHQVIRLGAGIGERMMVASTKAMMKKWAKQNLVKAVYPLFPV
ncbi:hypothetical protein BGZ60DRAFT_408329 [Tricladium varicosporioides]|nr:hypothetical protein BGZ60DRAFT_408329 [Hymenoscyphus varicosporioides]